MKNHTYEYIDNNKFQDFATFPEGANTTGNDCTIHSISVVPAHGVRRACVYTHLCIMCALHMRRKTSYDFSKLPTILTISKCPLIFAFDS